MIVKVAHLHGERRELDLPVHPDETLDTLLSKGLRIIQKRKGYRYSIDAILLAHFCHLKKGNRVIDLGTGNAIIPILLAARGLAGQIVGVEIQAELIDMARRNVVINEMQGRISLMQRDARDLPDCLDKASFDVAITNPPYRPVRNGRVNPHLQKALARHEILGSLEDMARVASFLLRPRGRFYVIYPTSRMVDMLLTLRKSDLESKQIQIVHSNATEDAKLVMAEAVKGGRRELRILRPLFVYDLEGRYTPEMEKIYTMLQVSWEESVARDQGK